MSDPAVLLDRDGHVLTITLNQPDRCDEQSEWNHSPNFVGRAFNWIMCNNGYHTIHHNQAGLHWSLLGEAHEREAKPRIDPSLDEPSMVLYLARTYLFSFRRPRALRDRTPTRAASARTRPRARSAGYKCVCRAAAADRDRRHDA